MKIKKMNKAQSTLEYFILFAVIAGLTLLSVSTFLTQTRQSGEDLFNTAVGRVLNAGNTPPEPPTPPNPQPNCNPSPSGQLGTKTNPYKINKPTQGYNIYISQDSADDKGSVTIPAVSKVYFEIDPVAVTGGPVPAFKVGIAFFSGGNVVCKLTQNKSTGAYSSEVCRGSDGYMDIVYDKKPDEIDSKRFLYAIDNSPGTVPVDDEIWATIP